MHPSEPLADDRTLAAKAAPPKPRSLQRDGDLISRGEVVARVNDVIDSLNGLSRATSNALAVFSDAQGKQEKIVSDLAAESERRYAGVVQSFLEVTLETSHLSRRLTALEQRGVVAWCRRLVSRGRGAR